MGVLGVGQNSFEQIQFLPLPKRILRMSIYLPFIVVFKGQFDHGNKTVGSFRQHSRNRKLFEELEHLWV